MIRQPVLSREFVLGTIGLALFFGIWEAIAVSGRINPMLLPTPFAVAERIVTLLTRPFADATLPRHLLASCRLFLSGFVLGVLVGVPLGIAMARIRVIDWIISPLFDAIRFIAPVAWVPFAALWFGTGIGGPIMIIFFGAFPPCLINAYRGVRSIDPRLIEAAEMLGTPPVRMWTKVLLPGALISIVAGLRVSAGLAWQVLVGAELITASAGVGYMMVRAQGAVSTATVMAGMIAIGVVGLLVDALIGFFQRSLTGDRASS